MSDDADEADIWNEGRRELKITHQDGTTEVVTIKKIPLKHMARLLDQAGADAQTALLYIEEDKDEAWFDGLDTESQLQLLEKGDEINSPLFDRWWKRKENSMAQMGVDLKKVIADEVVPTITDRASAASSPTSSHADSKSNSF